MCSATIGLAYLLLFFWLPAFALTEAEIIQAVRDFEEDQSLEVEAGSTEGMECSDGTFTATFYDAHVLVTTNGQEFEHWYSLLASPSVHVVGVHYYDRSCAANPSAPLQPLTDAQARALADQYALDHHPDHGAFDWVVEESEGLLSGTAFNYTRVLPNGAMVQDQNCSVEVDTQTGQVVAFSYVAHALEAGAKQPPALTPAEAEDEAAQEYSVLVGRTMTTQLVVSHGRLVYRIRPVYTDEELDYSLASLPAIILVNASTGEVVSTYHWKSAGLGALKQPSGMGSAPLLGLVALGLAVLLIIFLIVTRKRKVAM